jgi:hypothetical protein
MFIILVIMAAVNTERDNHVFPLFLKAKSVTVDDSASDITLSVDTSTNILNIDGNTNNGITLPDGKIVGQVMTVYMKAGSSTNFATVTITSAVDAAYDSIKLAGEGEYFTCIWNGEAWGLVSAATSGIAAADIG